MDLSFAQARGPARRSGRLQGSQPQTLDEDKIFDDLGIERLDLLPIRRRRIIDPEAIAALHAQRQSTGATSGGIDSGRGIRIQGGRLYDSKLGTTCHWCRQKTVEDHVECTVAGCGGGNRLRVSFCRMCLLNRHGEDVDLAITSGCWICPKCRGSCGPGCTNCCNCGPCRKRAGLSPTHQMVKLARISGFSNVHDFLVHSATGETAEAIASRKQKFSWGAWLNHEDGADGDEDAAVESDEEEMNVMVEEECDARRKGTFRENAPIVRMNIETKETVEKTNRRPKRHAGLSHRS